LHIHIDLLKQIKTIEIENISVVKEAGVGEGMTLKGNKGIF
jgi:hypothetical protein